MSKKTDGVPVGNDATRARIGWSETDWRRSFDKLEKTSATSLGRFINDDDLYAYSKHRRQIYIILAAIIVDVDREREKER